MAVVEFRPGDVLEVITGCRSVKGVNIEKSELISYDDLQEILSNSEDKPNRPKREYNTTPGAALSRSISLFARAIETGKWSNGAEINRDEVAESFVERVAYSETSDLKNINKKMVNKLVKAAEKNRFSLGDFSYDSLMRAVDVIRSVSDE